MNHDSSVCLSSFLIGGLTGAAVALLYAPRKGTETRQLVAEKANRAGQFAGDLRDRVTSGELRDTVVSKGREMLNEVADRGAAIVNRGVDYAKQATSGSIGG